MKNKIEKLNKSLFESLRLNEFSNIVSLNGGETCNTQGKASTTDTNGKVTNGTYTDKQNYTVDAKGKITYGKIEDFIFTPQCRLTTTENIYSIVSCEYTYNDAI